MPWRSRTVAAPLLAGILMGALAGVGCNKDTPTAPTSSAPPATCNFTVGDGPATPVAGAGAEFTVSVTTAATCSWSATSAAAFITVSGATSGTGSGSIRFAVQPNAAAARQGSIEVAGRTLLVSQAAGSPDACAFTLTPAASTMVATGGEVSIDVTVTSGANCTWTAQANDSFLSVKSGASGSENGNVVLAVAANTGAARIGTATVAGQIVSVVQDASTPPAVPCAFVVSPTQITVNPGGGIASFTVTKTQGGVCPWIAQPQSAFLTISGSSGGVDSGGVTLNVSANNTGSVRTGTAIIAGRTVTITQNALSNPCTFDVVPLQVSMPAAGGTAPIQISLLNGHGCPWTAQTSSPFVTFVGSASGVDSGTLTLSIAPNSGGVRTGTVQVANSVITITQSDNAGPCTFRIAPDTLTAGVGGGSAFINVTMTLGGPNCVWTALSSAPWVRFTSNSSGFGSGAFTIYVEPNPGAARSATIVAGGQTLSITQGGALPTNAAAVLSFDSDPGEEIGQGLSQMLTLIGSQFEANINQATGELTFNSPFGANPRFRLTLQAPIGQPLSTGYYDHAQRSPFQSPGQPGLDFSFGSRGCNSVAGRFLITQAVYTPGGTIDRFQARFEQHCEGKSAALRGQIWIDANGSTSPPTLAPFPATPSAPTTFFTYQSDPGDILGQGGSGTYTLANAIFTPSASLNGPQVTIGLRPPVGGGTNWNLQFIGTSGSFLLPGTYDPAVDPAAPGVPRLSVSGKGTCSATTGKFVVLEAVYGTQGDVYRFHATFELHCGSSPAVFHGEVYIVADPWR